MTLAQHSVELTRSRQLADEIEELKAHLEATRLAYFDAIRQAFPVGCIIEVEKGSHRMVTGHCQTALYTVLPGTESRASWHIDNVRFVRATP